MQPHEPNTADLVDQTLRGDHQAFGQLYDRYARLVRAVVGAVSADRPTAEDMTQEVFLRAYRKLAELRDPDRFGPWIVGIARHVARERRRTLHRDRHDFVDTDALSASATDTATNDDVASRLQHDEQLTQLRRQLETLPERERAAIHAFYLNEQNAPEAAELLGLSRSGFYALLKRAMTRLAGLVEAPEAREGSECP